VLSQQVTVIMQDTEIPTKYKLLEKPIRILSRECSENRWFFRSWRPQCEGKQKERHLFQTGGELFLRKLYLQTSRRTAAGLQRQPALAVRTQ